MIDLETARLLWTQLDVAQTAHLASAGVAYHFGKKGSPGERVFIWGGSAAFYALAACAVWHLGVYDWPTSYRVLGPEPFVLRVAGVELRSVDAAIQIALAGAFGTAAVLAAWAGGFFRRAAPVSGAATS